MRTWQEDGGTPGDTQPADTLVLDFQLPELLKIKVLLLKPEVYSFSFFFGSPSRVIEWPWKPRAESAGMSVFRVPGWPHERESYFHPAVPPALICAVPVCESFLHSGATG